MADENQPQNDGVQPGDTGQQTIESAENLDALFDQVATGEAPSSGTDTPPESGGAGGQDEGGESGATLTESADATSGSTSPSGSQASGEAQPSSAPNASDGPGPADNAAPGAGKGDAPPAQKAPLQQQPAEKTAKLSPVEEENRRLKGRVSALARENNDLRHRNTSPTASPHAAPGTASPASPVKDGAAPKSGGIKDALAANEKWQSVSKDYPEIAAPLEEVLGAVDGEFAEIRERREMQARAERGGIVAAAHPDAAQIVGTDAFKAWVGEQPAYVQRVISENMNGVRDPDACIDVFSRFKADTGISSTQASPANANGGAGNPSNADATIAARKARQQGAVEVPVKKGGETTNLPDDPDALFDRLASRKTA